MTKHVAACHGCQANPFRINSPPHCIILCFMCFLRLTHPFTHATFQPVSGSDLSGPRLCAMLSGHPGTVLSLYEPVVVIHDLPNSSIEGIVRPLALVSAVKGQKEHRRFEEER